MRTLQVRAAAHRAAPLLVLTSAALAIASFIGLLPTAVAFVFKPLTTLLIIAHAWPRGTGLQRRLILIGLALSLAGDVFLLWPQQGFLPGLVSFLLAHLAYIGAFRVPVKLGASPRVFIAYGVIAALILWQLWPGIPSPLRGPVVAYVVCLAAMAAQAGSWWRQRAGTGSADEPLARFAAIGGVMFMVSDSLLAVNKFAVELPLSSLWILATYWAAQWCIASSLEPRLSAVRSPAHRSG